MLTHYNFCPVNQACSTHLCKKQSIHGAMVAGSLYPECAVVMVCAYSLFKNS